MDETTGTEQERPLSREDRLERARTVLAQEGFKPAHSSFDGPGSIARLSAALRDVIEVAYQ